MAELKPQRICPCPQGYGLIDHWGNVWCGECEGKKLQQAIDALNKRS